MRVLFYLMAAAIAVAGTAHAGSDDASPLDIDCSLAGAWVDTASRERVARTDVLSRAAASGMVLLGESHDNPDHHLWQLQTVAALHARGGAVAIGFEMFPRRVQPVLDDWVAGGLNEAAFLATVEWDRVWGFDPALYMPLFNFARINRLPMVALNVDRGLIAGIREKGWAAVPEAAREGVSDPMPPDEAYRESLNEVYLEHLERREQEPDEAGLMRFVEVQLTWDRAMAEALATAAIQDTLLIGIIGSGHLENRWGVPRQLAALGYADAAVLLPWDRGRDCADLTAVLADAVFGLDVAEIDETDAPWRPRLGVAIKTVEGVLRVLEVVSGSVAEAAGIEADDVIAMAAGVAVVESRELVGVIGRQAPGTWLPLTLERNGESLDVIAKFPPAP